jgi:hypothetical protein
MVRWASGGIAWHHLQYAMGFHRLGHDVFFLEDSGDTEWCCFHPNEWGTWISDSDPTYGLDFAAKTFSAVGLGDRWGYYDAHKECWHGPIAGRGKEICRTADLLLNLSCCNAVRPWLEDVPLRVLIDTDPGFTQVRHLTDAKQMATAKKHNRFLTFGENIPSGGSTVPADGFPWMPTRQPIILDSWPVVKPKPDAKFTTIMAWDSYGIEEYNGLRLAMKSESFEPYFDLPTRVNAPLELALGSEQAPREELRSQGWSLVNPIDLTVDPWRYRTYIQGSKAEFTIAKHGYVITQPGWFSERSAAYLASGRPVLTQATGFSNWMPTGEGLLEFSSPAEAAERIDDINSRYELHCRAARALAEEFFDSGKVLADVLDRTMGVA